MTSPAGGPDVTADTAELVESVVRLMPDAAVVVDGDGTIVAANALAEVMFGFTSGTLGGMAVDLLVPDRLRPGHAHHRSTYTAHPTQRPMGASLELWAMRRDGTEFPVDISLAPLGVSEPPFTLAALRDLTERRAEWEAQARLVAIVSSSDDAIVSTALDGTFTSWNPGAKVLLGYDAEDVIGHPASRIAPDALRAELEEQMARVRAGLPLATRDIRLLHQDGHEVDVAESMSLIRDQAGDPIGISLILRDITERKRAERELRRLLVEAQRRERWIGAISEIRLVMLGGGTIEDWMPLITRRVAELADADGATLDRVVADGEALEVIAAHGKLVADLRDRKVSIRDSHAGRAFRSGRLVIADDGHLGARTTASGAAGARIGPVVYVPLTTTSHGIPGVLGAFRATGRAAFNPEEIRMLESLGQLAALAFELDRAQDDRQQLALVADRERIARDLHDHVIQRLFAVGMALQAASRYINDSAALERISESVDELDATIRDVRSTIFSLELRATERVPASLRSRVLDLSGKAAGALGFQPRVQFDGPIDSRVPEDMVHDVLAVVRETLSNTARHAEASMVEVRIAAHDDLTVTVTDDGKGMGDTTRASGLLNLRTRAESRGGTMTVGGVDGKGTRLQWKVPLPA